MKRRVAWTKSQIEELKRIYQDMSTQSVAQLLGRPVCSVYTKAHALGLHKSAAYMASPSACRLRRGDNVGAAYRYPKGHVPANKGTRRPGYTAGRMAETQFKKGQVNHNVMQIGATRLVDGYRYTKISQVRYVPYTVNWKPTHILLWTKHRGPVPEGHCVIFKDGDRTNIRMSNLKMITRGKNAVRNSMWTNYPTELAKAIQLRGALKRKINRRSQQHEEQDRRSA